MALNFSKYHALGTTTSSLTPKDLPAPLTTEQVKTICHPQLRRPLGTAFLLGPLPATNAKCVAEDLQS